MLSADVNCDMTGFDRIDDELRQYINANLEGIAHEVKDRAKANIKNRTGRLRRSVRVRETKDGEFRVVASAPHAHLVEFGHVQENKKGKIIGHVPPHPFLRPARDEVINELLRSGGKGYDFAKASGVFDDYWKG